MEKDVKRERSWERPVSITPLFRIAVWCSGPALGPLFQGRPRLHSAQTLKMRSNMAGRSLAHSWLLSFTLSPAVSVLRVTYATRASLVGAYYFWCLVHTKLFRPTIHFNTFSHCRSRPDSRQHVSDCRHQPGPGKSTRSGGHGSHSHTHRQHGNARRTGGGGGDPGAVTYSTPAAGWDRKFRTYLVVAGIYCKDVLTCYQTSAGVVGVFLFFTL